MKQMLTFAAVVVLSVFRINAGWIQGQVSGEGIVESLFADDSIVLASTADDLFRSTTYGINWKKVLPGVSVRVFLKVGTDIFAGGSGTIRRSTDNGLSWTRSDSGLPENVFCSINSFGTNIYNRIMSEAQ